MMKMKKVLTMLVAMVMVIIISVSAVSAKGKKGETVKKVAITGKVATKRKRRTGIHISQGFGEKVYSDDDAPVIKVESDGDAKAKIADMISKKVTHFEVMDIDPETENWINGAEDIQDSLSRDGYLNDIDADETCGYSGMIWKHFIDGEEKSHSLEMKMRYRLSPDKAAAWRQMAASVKAPENMNYLSKVRWIHNWVCRRCTPIPQYGATAGHNGYEAIVDRKGVCEGYAILFKAICDANGITSRYVFGSVRSKYDHAWNAVLYKGEWYFVDVYWDDEAWTMSKSPKMTYFMYGAKSKQYRQHKQLDAMESRKLDGHCIANVKKAKETV